MLREHPRVSAVGTAVLLRAPEDFSQPGRDALRMLGRHVREQWPQQIVGRDELLVEQARHPQQSGKPADPLEDCRTGAYWSSILRSRKRNRYSQRETPEPPCPRHVSPVTNKICLWFRTSPAAGSPADGKNLGCGNRTAADLGAWICFGDETGQGVLKSRNRSGATRRERAGCGRRCYTPSDWLPGSWAGGLQRAEELADVPGEQLGFFQGWEMPATIELGPSGHLVSALGQFPWRRSGRPGLAQVPWRLTCSHLPTLPRQAIGPSVIGPENW